jgi:hypothetical protein
VAGFHEYSADFCQTAAQANSNANYRDIAAKWGTDTLDSVFTNYFAGNLVFYPIVALLVWLVLGIVLFGIVRIVGGQISAGAFLTMMAYPYFFGIIGFACLLAGLLPDTKGLAGGAPAMGLWSIIGGLLFLYSLILTMIGVNQGAECGATRMLISVIILLVLLGGGSWAGVNYGAKPVLDKFHNNIKGFDPSKANFTLPNGI